MAGKFRKIQSLLWQIKVDLPTGKTEKKKVKGKTIEQPIYDQEIIEVKFKRLPKDDLADFYARHMVDENEASAEEKIEAHKGMVDEITNDLMIGWKIEDDDGQDLEFNQENKAMVMGHPDYHSAIVAGFMEMQQGGARKN